MYDSNYKSSKEIEIDLQKVSDGYELSIKPDKKWLDSSERTYPVYIDPAVQISTNPSFNLCEVDSDSPNSNYQPTDHMSLDYYEDGNYGPSFDFLKVQLPQLTKSQVVTGASIQATNSYNDGYYPSYVNIHRVLSDWNPSTITWNNQPQHDSNIQQYQTLNNAGQAYTWDITQVVKDWYNTGINYGLYIDMTADGAPPPTSWWDVYPYYHYATFTRPQITISYIDDAQPPTVPTNLAASALTSTSLTLTWQASTDNVGVAGYDIYNGSTKIGSTTGTTYNFTGLSRYNL